MSKMSDMAATIEELRTAAAAINDAANWLSAKGVAGFAVHLVDEGKDGDVAQGAHFEQLDGLGLDALCGVDDHDS